MDWSISDEGRALVSETKAWRRRVAKQPPEVAFDAEVWRSFLALGILDVEDAGGSLVDLVLGVINASAGGLPGPIVEADLARATGNTQAIEGLEQGLVVTSVWPGDGGQVVVPWGAAADLVIDQSTGSALAGERTPAVGTIRSLPHDWMRVEPAAGSDRFRERRTILTSAALIGLCEAALDMAAEHARTRHQFGRPLGANQAVQLLLSEPKLHLAAARSALIDAAWRVGTAHAAATPAAALTWISLRRAARLTSRNAHQVFGAMGFAAETGLERLTAEVAWLLATIDAGSTRELALIGRGADPVDPPSGVLDGYAS